MSGDGKKQKARSESVALGLRSIQKKDDGTGVSEIGKDSKRVGSLAHTLKTLASKKKEAPQFSPQSSYGSTSSLSSSRTGTFRDEGSVISSATTTTRRSTAAASERTASTLRRSDLA